MDTDPPVTVRFPDRYTCSVFGPDSWAAPPPTAKAVAFPRSRLRPAKVHAPPVRRLACWIATVPPPKLFAVELSRTVFAPHLVSPFEVIAPEIVFAPPLE